MTDYAEQFSPDFILLAHFSDDTMLVICHYHGDAPSEAEVNEMCADFYRSNHTGLIGFQMAEVTHDSSPEKLGLTQKAHS